MASEELNEAADDGAQQADQEQQAATGGKSRKKGPFSNTGNIVLAGVLVAGMVLVYLLGTKNGPVKASAEQQKTQKQVDTALSQLSKFAEKDKKAAEVVESFYLDASQRQVPATDLKCNPFVFRIAPVLVLENSTPHVQQVAVVQDRSSIAISEALSAVKSLRLQLVLTGEESNSALISNCLVTEGQVISGWIVEKIESGRVTLRYADQQYVLTMTH